MKNKRLVILFILLIAALAVFFYDRYKEKILPVKLNVQKIETVEISSNSWYEDSWKVITLSNEKNVDEIAEVARLFNESVMHENQKMGTTHPTRVIIKYDNGKKISFGCGVGAIFTVARGKTQYNYVNGELDRYIADSLAQG